MQPATPIDNHDLTSNRPCFGPCFGPSTDQSGRHSTGQRQSASGRIISQPLNQAPWLQPTLRKKPIQRLASGAHDIISSPDRRSSHRPCHGRHRLRQIQPSHDISMHATPQQKRAVYLYSIYRNMTCQPSKPSANRILRSPPQRRLATAPATSISLCSKLFWSRATPLGRIPA